MQISKHERIAQQNRQQEIEDFENEKVRKYAEEQERREREIRQ